MFTGLVKDIGIVRRVVSNSEGKYFEIDSAKLSKDIEVDDSVSINGACQTATKVDGSTFGFQSVWTTLEKTTLGKLKEGSRVNLELALRVGDRLGGHIVQGHINAVGKILDWKNQGNNYVVRLEAPREIQKYIVKEGSITIDGISLTVSDERSGQFWVSVIPHTWNNTLFKFKTSGSSVNLEVDVLAKYIEKLISHKNNLTQSNVSMELLTSKGF